MVKGDTLSLFVFIDALGWELLRAHPSFLADVAPNRAPLHTILGYSNGCDPSIISGTLPSEHGFWSSYYYSPESSPFRLLAPLQILPSAVLDYHRVRNRLSRTFASWNGYTGYFQLYNVPFDHLPLFDYAEKHSIWVPGGMGKTRSIFDDLTSEGIAYWVDATGIGDEQQFRCAKAKIEAKELSFAYLLLGKLDGLMHAKGTQHPDVSELLRWYQRQLSQLMQAAEKRYQEVALYVFSDHGMHDVTAGVDLQAEVESLGFHFGTDYTAFYDSTMARFWFHKQAARREIGELLGSSVSGAWVDDDTLKQQGVHFSDHQYGERVFLLHPGKMIAPSFMGRRAIAGMHGYDPFDSHSLASIASNKPLPAELTKIHHIHRLMMQEAGICKGATV